MTRARHSKPPPHKLPPPGGVCFGARGGTSTNESGNRRPPEAAACRPPHLQKRTQKHARFNARKDVAHQRPPETATAWKFPISRPSGLGNFQRKRHPRPEQPPAGWFLPAATPPENMQRAAPPPLAPPPGIHERFGILLPPSPHRCTSQAGIAGLYTGARWFSVGTALRAGCGLFSRIAAVEAAHLGRLRPCNRLHRPQRLRASLKSNVAIFNFFLTNLQTCYIQ